MNHSTTKIAPFPRIELVPGTSIAVGHCVILNDFEKPCGRLLCVITEIEKHTVYCKYLNSDSRYDIHNRGRGMRVELRSTIHNITPVNLFGVRVFYDFDGDRYMCEKTGESQAVYADGSARKWQGNWSEVINARRDLRGLLKAAQPSASEGKQ